MHMSNSRTPSMGQWEEQVWCAAGWQCCLGRVLLLHPLGLMGTLFLKSLCCCHFSCLTSQKYMLGVQLLLSAASGTALRAVQERAGIIPSCAAASSRAGQRRTGRSILCRDLWSCGHQNASDNWVNFTRNGVWEGLAMKRKLHLLYCSGWECVVHAYQVFI